MDPKATLQHMLASRHVDFRWLVLMALFGVLLIAVPAWLSLSDMGTRRTADRAEQEGLTAADRVAEIAASLQRLLDDEQVQALAARALAQPDKTADLEQYLSGRTSEISGVKLYPPDLQAFDPAALPANGYALLEMLMAARDGLNPPLQLHAGLKPPMLVEATAVKEGEALAGYLVILVDPEYVLSRFDPDMSESSYISLTQNNGRQASSVLKQRGNPAKTDTVPNKLLVNGTLFRVELPMVFETETLHTPVLITFLILGLLLLALSVYLYRKNQQWELERPPAKLVPAYSADAEPLASPAEPASAETRIVSRAPPAPARVPDLPSRRPEEESEEGPPRMRLPYELKERPRERASDLGPVELTPGIFRAYDIRGVIGKTLDAGVAAQVGQVLGTLALERNAGPVVVARDGRLSGPSLVAGMIEGITSTGCNVLDIGAVPTGVMYFAAHELAAGTGVVITGSHNPPDYNGFKIMLAGDTLYGNQITDIYHRITRGDVQKGQGEVEHRNVLMQYRKRISSDIKLERPLRVVIDCGNGIGGICAADVLRDIGAEVLPLFDEVDGTFPNHHPDPSEPENLQDLIQSVRLMDADLGLALDGDADRLGVVTMGGAIIYPDRVMMLLAMDVLDRVPGATIIYDVKCTGHLAKVIEKAGGKPVMYKTGHSLIKAKMKELGSPFAGEMSGHFFFGERWYGVDDGIYAAARLLEILAGSEVPPEAILNALPTSFSTPELKVQMREGENHAFVETFQAKARFEGAKVSTI
ncbi:MAG: phosphomannomutase/phosphoglucomutase, partial [Proteobacteria bacterium]|nr:phosphomannomutase/phosphoglucomutase [Pseudomonadota bacterium]